MTNWPVFCRDVLHRGIAPKQEALHWADGHARSNAIYSPHGLLSRYSLCEMSAIIGTSGVMMQN